MTIAIGMLHADGVLICADTLVTTGVVEEYQSKIQAYRFHDGCAVFALAGTVIFAEAVIQRCEKVLRDSRRKRTRAELGAAIGDVLTKEYRIHVPPAGPANYECSIIVAVRSNIDGIELYSSQSGFFTRSKTGLACIGAAYDVAQMLIRPKHKTDAPYKRAWNDAAYTIGVIKRQMSGCVGGEPIFLNLSKDGEFDLSGYAKAKNLETFTACYEQESRSLLSAFMDLEDDDRFTGQLERFASDLRHFRKQWQENDGPLCWSNPPIETEGIVIDLS